MLSIQHIDTCTPDYLQDHHNREGEYLIGVPLDNTTTNAEVKQALLDAWHSADGIDDTPMLGFDNRVCMEIEALFENTVPCDAFDDSLDEQDDENGGELPQAWFLLKWSDEDEGADNG